MGLNAGVELNAGVGLNAGGARAGLNTGGANAAGGAACPPPNTTGCEGLNPPKANDGVLAEDEDVDVDAEFAPNANPAWGTPKVGGADVGAPKVKGVAGAGAGAGAAEVMAGGEVGPNDPVSDIISPFPLPVLGEAAPKANCCVGLFVLALKVVDPNVEVVEPNAGVVEEEPNEGVAEEDPKRLGVVEAGGGINGEDAVRLEGAKAEALAAAGEAPKGKGVVEGEAV